MAIINLKDIILVDKLPGSGDRHLGKPDNSWDSTEHSCVTTPVYPVGQKRWVRQDNTHAPGEACFVYAQFHDGTDAGIAVGDVSDGYNACFHAEGTATADGSVAHWYQMTNDLTNSDGTIGGSMVFFAADLSSDQYGWGWCGGVCPIDDVTKFNAEIKTNGKITAGAPLAVQGDGTLFASLMVADITSITDITDGETGTTQNQLVAWATQADT